MRFSKIEKQFKRTTCFEISIRKKYSKELKIILFSSGAGMMIVIKNISKNMSNKRHVKQILKELPKIQNEKLNGIKMLYRKNIHLEKAHCS